VIDFGHPWLRPLWRRVAVVALAAGWGLFELVSGSPGWALLFLALGAWLGWGLLLTYRPNDREDT